jgi:hypothetical protein
MVPDALTDAGHAATLNTFLASLQRGEAAAVA